MNSASGYNSRKNNKKTGGLGEEIAGQFLSDSGYRILDRNFRYSTFGEIDIIAERNDILVFVEVKTYRTKQFGEPELLVTARKQRQVRKMAEIYLLQKKITDMDCRFDVIGINLAKREGEPDRINHIENAF